MTPYRLGIIALSSLILLSIPLRASAAGPEKPRTHGCGPAYPSDRLLEWDCVRIKKGETLEKLFGEAWKDIARFNRMDRRHSTPGRRMKVPRDISKIKDFTPMPARYAQGEKEPKLVLVVVPEQFLGAYEYGRLVFSSPVTTGEEGNETPKGSFRITFYSRNHRSSKYFMEKTSVFYPMNFALRFHIDRNGVSYWIHGRDMPGLPASHGCIGLYNEEMQEKFYGVPKDPALEDARTLYEWATGGREGAGTGLLKDGPKVVVTDRTG